MTAGPVHIRPLTLQDESAWRALWRGYCDFYAERVAEAVTAYTWQRLLDPAIPIHGIVAETDRGVIGFANFVTHEGTWETRPLCYLEDLFVAPAARGQGAGRALIEWLVAEMDKQNWSRLYWLTKENNQGARALYDQFTPRDEFVRYCIDRRERC